MVRVRRSQNRQNINPILMINFKGKKMDSQIEVVLGDQNVILDLSDLKFTDTTLNEFFEKIGGRIDYVGRCLANANRVLAHTQQQAERQRIKQYIYLKSQGDKMSDATAKVHSENDQLHQQLIDKSIEIKYVRDQLQYHLNALNAAREDAHNRGHMLRKEIDKLGGGSTIFFHKDDLQDFSSMLKERQG